jgi:hypothetical protein
MSAELQTLADGSEALIVTTGTKIEVFALDVIASYSELLGEPDPGKTVILIRGAMKTTDHTGLWQTLYEHLSEGLGELAEAGVPHDRMPDVLEEATRAGGRRVKARRLRAARQAARARLASGGGNQSVAEFNALLADRAGKLKEARVEFLKAVTPPPPERVRTDPSPFEEKQETQDGQ